MFLSDEGVRAGLTALPTDRKLAFGLFLAASAKPAFDVFAADTSWSGGAALDCALATIRRCLAGQRPAEGELATLRLAIVAAAPDTEDFDHPVTSAALNAAATAGHVIDYLCDGDDKNLLWAAQCGFDTADFNGADEGGEAGAASAVEEEGQRQARAIATIGAASSGDLMSVVEKLVLGALD
jgi:hypothetical protein